MTSDSNGFLASRWDRNISTDREKFQDVYLGIGFKLDSKSLNEAQDRLLKREIDDFIHLLHQESSSLFSLWATATIVMGDVLSKRVDDDKSPNEPCKTQCYHRLNQGIQSLIPPKPSPGIRIDRATENALVWETQDPDPYYDF